MGTVSAQMLVGGKHMNDGGILPTHKLYLWEGSRAAWILSTEEGSFTRKAELVTKKVKWIPTVEHMLEDGLAMIAVYVDKNPLACNFIRKRCGHETPAEVDIYATLDESKRVELYEICKNIRYRSKLMLTAWNGSHLIHQLERLHSYDLEMEVSIPTFSRLSSPWTPGSGWEEKGTLKSVKFL